MKKKLALSAASLLFALLFAEGALRLLGIGAAGRGSPWFAGGNHPRFLFQPDLASGYTLRPGFRGREIAPGNEFDVPAVIDARGLRDPSHPPQTAPPVPCVLAVGDSMTFGEGVPADRTYSAWLERTVGVRVYNAGVPGFSSRQMLARLRRFLPALRPAAVVMTLSPLWDRQRCATPFVYKAGYIVAPGYADRLVPLGGNLYLEETRLPVLGSATAYAKRYSALMRLALPGAAGAARALLHRSRESPPTSATDLEPTARNLAAAQHLAESFGARFVAVLVDDRGEEFRHDRELLESRLHELGVPFLAADEILPGADWRRLRYARDGHWNAAGHEAVGKALAPRIQALLGRR
jgi:lysophospholipase L1-like esterase